MRWLRYGVLLLAVVGCSRRDPAPAPSAVSSRAALIGEARPHLLKDVNALGGPSYPQSFTNVKGTLFFVAQDAVNGQELWKSDGTVAGTVLIKDLYPGPGNSSPQYLTSVNGTLYFSANDGVNGVELWKSDGTAAGTVLVTDLNPGVGNANPSGLTNVNGTLYFSANDGVNGPELWKSDGTAAGTVLVKSISPGSLSPRNLANINGTLYFSATDGVTGLELWKSDGTAAGTVLVKDLYPGATHSLPSSLTNVNGTLFFVTGNSAVTQELWKSDGTAAGTVLLKSITPGVGGSGVGFLTNVNGTLFFSANGNLTGPELWKSDGTAAGTGVVKDIVPGADGGGPYDLVDFNGTLYFGVDDRVNGAELWKSDGTAAGTVRVTDLAPGGLGAYPQGLTNVDGTLYFNADDGVKGAELWKSDGTAAGTVLVRDIAPGLPSSRPQRLMNVDGLLYFTATEGVTGVELWKSDGSAEGTLLVEDINPATGDASPYQPTDVNGTLFFSAKDGVRGYELWKSDGTAAGTVLVKDLIPGSGDSAPYWLTNVNGTLFFTANDGVNGYEVWKSDGTAEGTVLVKDIFQGSGFSFPEQLTNVKGTLFFVTNDGVTGPEVWKSDGTAQGTVLIKDINPDPYGGNPLGLTNVNGTLFFSTSDGVTGSELWKSDGTAQGTVLVKDIAPGSGSSAPFGLTNFNGALYFAAGDAVNGVELWKSDGTAEGTVLVKDLLPGTGSASPYRLTTVNGTLYFLVSDSAGRTDLWKSDGTATGTVLVKKFNPGLLTSYARVLKNVNDTLYLSINDGVNGQELWKSDGTDTGTVLVKDIAPGTRGANPQSLLSFDGRLYFTADDGARGLELWKSDGTAEGTVLVQDLYPGPSGSSPSSLMEFSGWLVFSATTPLHGSELWAIGDNEPPTVTCPADQSALATSASGARVSYPPATATDDQTASPRLSSSVDSGSLFALGSTAVTVTATDEAGNSARCGFTVSVVPPAPTVTAPLDGASSLSPVTLAGTALEGATVRVLEDTTVLGTFTADASGAFGGTLALESRVHALRFTQTLAGLTSAPSAASTLFVRPPPPSLTAPADGLSTTTPGVAVSGSGLPGATLAVREGGAVLATLPVDGAGTFAGTVSLGYGVHVLRFTQSTPGGTSEEASARTVTVLPPALVLTAPAEKARVPGPEVLLVGRALAGARVFAEESGLSLGSTFAGSEGSFLLRVSLPYGPHGLLLWQEVDGVTGPVRTGEFTVVPAPPVLSQPLDGATVGSHVEVKGVGLPLAHVTVREGTEVLATLTADADGAFAADVSLAYGPHTLTAVQRVAGEKSDASAPVHLTAVFNRAPVADAQELSVAEDGRLAVGLTASDADGERFTFSVRTPPAHGSLEGTPPGLTYVPAPDFHGTDRFTFAVSDGELEATATVLLTVTPVNDAPVASVLAATTSEGQPLSLTLSGGDVDGDGLTYEVVTGPARGSLQGAPPEVTYTPAPGFAGEDAFTFRVSDGRSESLPATVSVRVVATTLAVSASDLHPPEGSAVAFSAALADASATPAFTWDFGDGTTSSEAAPRHAFRDDGVYTVRVRATDADGSREASLTLTVRNASPLVEHLSLPDSVSEAQEVVLSALAVDPAGSADTLEYQWNFGDGSPQASGPSVRHAFRDDGPFTVELTVRDEDGGETRARATLTVSNVPPSATAPERQSVKVGESLRLQLSASDVAGAGDALTWKKLSGPGAVTPEGTFTWAPTRDDVGEATVRLEVSDDEGGRSEVTLVVEVLPLLSVDVPETGCGCGARGGPSGLLALLLGLGALARRARP